jgi:hypothetical protein
MGLPAIFVLCSEITQQAGLLTDKQSTCRPSHLGFSALAVALCFRSYLQRRHRGVPRTALYARSRTHFPIKPRSGLRDT